MTDYRIVCTKQEPVSQPPSHAHIVAVGIGNDPSRATERLTLAEVIKKMKEGHRFYTYGSRTGKSAWVESYYCNSCKREHIRSKPDSTTDNNLDSLRYCNWKN